MNIFWLLVRIAGWLVGIYALLKLARATGTVTYTQVFQAWMDSLRGIVDLGFLLTPLKIAAILPALDLIRSFDIPIPPLQEHWQQLFVLTWLVSAAFARNLSFGVLTPVAIGIAFICTLPFCVAAGTMPIGTVAIVAWPSAAIFAFIAIASASRANKSDGPKFAFAAAIGLVVSFAALGYFLGTTGERPDQLVILAYMVGGMGFSILLLGLYNGSPGQRFQHPLSTAGLDVIAVLLGAFGLATVFADPPLF